MKVASFISNRLAFNRQKSFSRFIIRLSVAATLISVAVMIITLAFTNGFQETVSQKVFSFMGHIRVQDRQPMKSSIAEEILIQKNDTVVDLIKKNPQVASIHPFATKYAVLQAKESIDGVLMKGFDSGYSFNHLKPFLRKGRWLKFDSGYSKEIVLSTHTAEQLNVKLNDSILIYFIQPNNEKPRARKIAVVGIYKTGIEEYDKQFAIGDLRLIQRLNNWRSTEIGGYEIFLKDYKQMDKVADELFYVEEFPSTWDTRSITDLYPNIFDWLGMQDRTRDILIIIMIVIAVINLITCLVILVLERIRMIGVLKALGARNWTVQQIFLYHSSIITIIGTILGAIIGLGVCWLQKKTGFIKLKEEAYYMTTAAVKISWWEVGLICGLTLVVCILVLTIPSLIVRKIRPVKAIQFR